MEIFVVGPGISALNLHFCGWVKDPEVIVVGLSVQMKIFVVGPELIVVG